jgi:hypothetical protein
MLYRVINPLLFLVNIETLYNYSKTVVRSIIKSIFKINRKAFLNLYSKAILAEIKKNLIISR